MKSKIFYAIALLALFLTSCSKDQTIEDPPTDTVSLDVPDFENMTEAEMEAFFTSPEMLAPGPDEGNVDPELLNAAPVEDGLTGTIAKAEDIHWIGGKDNKRSSSGYSITWTKDVNGAWTIQQKNTSGGWDAVYWGFSNSVGVQIPYLPDGSSCSPGHYDFRMFNYTAHCTDVEFYYSQTGVGGLDTDVRTIENGGGHYFRIRREDHTSGPLEYCVMKHSCSGVLTECD